MDKNELIKLTEENELMQFLGVKIEMVEPERTVLTMEVTSKVHQYIGIMHGGVSLFLSETAASIAAVCAADLTQFAPVGIEINANHLRAVNKGKITVEAKPLYNGKSMSVWNVEITNDKGKLICISRCSVLHRKGAARAR
jgi:1,4-dihydroxy-2-naphthoyl-CoA hydrolase